MGAYYLPTTIVGVIVLLVIAIVSMWKKVPQDKALVVTGLKRRVITGGGGLIIPLLERFDKISLENMKIEVTTDGALTEQGVPIIADAVAIVKVKSDMSSILSAVEQFNTGNELKTIEVIKDMCSNVLDGKLREIVSTLSVEDIYKDREKFVSKVQDVADKDLAQMGLEIITFTIKDIDDPNEYLKALGASKIADVKRDAEIAEAEAKKETKIKTSIAFQKGEEAKILAETEIARASKEKELKVQEYREEQEIKKAKADLAYEIEANSVKKKVVENEMQVELVRQERQKELTEKEMQVEITKKEREIDLARSEAIRKAEELKASVEKIADAEKYKKAKEAEARNYQEVQDAQARAEAIRLEGEAKAKAKRVEGMAEVDIIEAKGKAEAEAMLKKAEAYKQYNDAAVTQMIIEKLPEIAREIAQPLAKTEKIVIVDNGSSKDGSSKGASKVTGYVTDMMAQLPETVEALTGLNVMDLLSGKNKETNVDLNNIDLNNLDPNLVNQFMNQNMSDDIKDVEDIEVSEIETK